MFRIFLSVGVLFLVMFATSAAFLDDFPENATRLEDFRECSLSHLATLASRCLPHFLLIGAQKSGTSTISELMSQHPQIVLPKRKELLFYMPDLSVEKYGTKSTAIANCHPSKRQKRLYLERFGKVTPALYHNSGQITGEWSATYLACACCAFAAHSFTPKAKLIAILRHPIDRALSRYHEQQYFLKRAGESHELFSLRWPQFVDHYLSEVRECRPHAASGNGDDRNASSDLDCPFANTAAYAVIGWSRYAPQLEPWISAYGHKAILVLYTDDLKTDPGLTMRRIEEHVDILPFSGYQHVNASYNGKFTAPKNVWLGVHNHF